MNLQVQSRTAGERHAQGTLIRLLCAVSVWRTVVTRLLPICGASAWWTALICLLPGVAAAALLRIAMHITRTDTLAEMLRACLGKAGTYALAILLAVLLLAEGGAAMTALMTLFTEGIGTRGTQLTLALLTGAVLLISLHREGLPRAAHFLRWLMAAAAVLVGAFLLAEAKVDHLFPLYGEGRAAVTEALKAGASLAWPLTLLLTVEPAKGAGRLRSAILPLFGAVGAVLLLTLAVPHELLVQDTTLAGAMLLTVRFVPNAVRVIAHSLMMLAFFLSIGASAQLTASSLCLPLTKAPGWLSYALVGALILTQAIDAAAMWKWLGAIEPWLVVPLLALAALCLPIALVRRKMR